MYVSWQPEKLGHSRGGGSERRVETDPPLAGSKSRPRVRAQLPSGQSRVFYLLRARPRLDPFPSPSTLKIDP
jgi:hypothetical protein